MVRNTSNKTIVGIFFLMAMLLIPSVYAWEWDNVKSYDPTTREVLVSNSIAGIPTTYVGTARLNTPLFYRVEAGKDKKVAEFNLLAYQDYFDAIKPLTFINLKSGKIISKEYELKYFNQRKVIVDDIKLECYPDEKSLNKSQICEEVIVGNHVEIIDEWVKSDFTNLKKGESFRIGIFCGT